MHSKLTAYAIELLVLEVPFRNIQSVFKIMKNIIWIKGGRSLVKYQDGEPAYLK